VRKYLVADLFCGAGGSSTGAERAIQDMGGAMELCAVNHWPLAIETHQKNHPTARHYVEDVTTVRPETLVPEGRLDLLMASPECTYFSRARGGKPMSDQGRMPPWSIPNWLTRLDIRCLLVENVPEFVEWGPVLPSGRPDPGKKGQYFSAWLRTIWELGYEAEFRKLNAADFGDATTRERFFLIARKDGQPIRWPTPTHSPSGASDMFGRLEKWRAARSIIEWDKPGRSLLDDPRYLKRPLAENTRRRIARGLEKFGGPFAPYYVRLLGLDGTVVGDGEPVPFIMGKQSRPTYRDTGQPLPTITTLAAPVLIEPTAEPFVLGQQSGSAPRSTDHPIPTVAADGAISLVDPVITSYYGTLNVSPVDSPLPTVTTKDRFGLAAGVAKPFTFQVNHPGSHESRIRSVDEPLPTATTKRYVGLVQPFIVPNFGEAPGQAPRVHDVDNPLPAVTGHGAGALVEPAIIQTDQTGWNGTVRSADDPLGTIVTKQNMALVEPILKAINDGDVDPRRVVLVNGVPHILDIRFRMLNNLELARAMGFSDDESEYEFAGNVGEVTKQIGNAVPVRTAKALVGAILSEDSAEERQPAELVAVAD